MASLNEQWHKHQDTTEDHLMAKNYSIEVWNVQFYKVDDEGNALLNADGSIKLFDADIDVSAIAEGMTNDDLVEEMS